MTDLDFLKEAEAWLSFNGWPSREQIGNFKESLKKQITISENAPQSEVNAFGFAEWVAANYMRINGAWVLNGQDRRDPKTWISTDTLWQFWAKQVKLPV